ncbi:hypothetical protein NW762_012560 [Fusarium torreyae]|uniref:Ankyrin repeat protein n=1 Tax=Fusarium torreyae TaxID=1237075 RepID=A0A9W8RM59_9HYPO|nr:hypothetical protein NW762_012560 [Fusarium torreyae]
MDSQLLSSKNSRPLRLPDELLLNILRLSKTSSDKINLAMTSTKSGNFDILRACLKVGAPLDCHPSDRIDQWKARPLVRAIFKQNPGVVDWLLAHGASPNEIEGDGEAVQRTPLHYAVEAALFPRDGSDLVQSYRRGRAMFVPTLDSLLLKARWISAALRRAGANDDTIDPDQREHLDSIQTGRPCCPQHKPHYHEA